MTNEEAIERLHFFKKEDSITKLFRGVSQEVVTENQALIDLCIKALEKQMPKPIDWQDRPNRYQETINEPFCPTCGCLVYEDDVYCSYCGQKILWESEND